MKQRIRCPQLAARDGRVFIVWNVCADVNPIRHVRSFICCMCAPTTTDLHYQSPWKSAQIIPLNLISFSTSGLSGSDSAAGLVSAYATHLRPVGEIGHATTPSYRLAGQDGKWICDNSYPCDDGYNRFFYLDPRIPCVGICSVDGKPYYAGARVR